MVLGNVLYCASYRLGDSRLYLVNEFMTQYTGESFDRAPLLKMPIDFALSRRSEVGFPLSGSRFSVKVFSGCGRSVAASPEGPLHDGKSAAMPRRKSRIALVAPLVAENRDGLEFS